VFLFVAFCLLY